MIFVGILTKDRPIECLKTIQILEQTCDDRSNFVIHLAIDRNQLREYRSVTCRPEVIFDEYPPCKGNLKILYSDQIRKFFSSSRYFFWTLPDDVTHIDKGWDSRIVSTYKRFEDDLFYLYTESTERSRNVAMKASCYSKEHCPPGFFESKRTTYECLPYVMVEAFGDMTPVVSLKFAEYTLEAMACDDHHIGIDIINGSLVQALNNRFSINRAVLGPGNVQCIDQAKTAQILRKNPINQNVINIIADRMAIYIHDSKEKK